MKADKIILRETGYIAFMVLVFSVLLESVYLVIGGWDYTVLLGNLLGAATAVLNFFLLGLTVQKAVLDEPDDAKKRIKASQTLRLLMQVFFAIIGAAVPCFNIPAVLLPLLFPRIAIALQGLFVKEK